MMAGPREEEEAEAEEEEEEDSALAVLLASSVAPSPALDEGSGRRRAALADMLLVLKATGRR
jgi:hypothetical protein